MTNDGRKAPAHLPLRANSGYSLTMRTSQSNCELSGNLNYTLCHTYSGKINRVPKQQIFHHKTIFILMRHCFTDEKPKPWIKTFQRCSSVLQMIHKITESMATRDLKVTLSNLPGDVGWLPILDQANCDLLSQVPNISMDG